MQEHIRWLAAYWHTYEMRNTLDYSRHTDTHTKWGTHYIIHGILTHTWNAGTHQMIHGILTHIRNEEHILLFTAYWHTYEMRNTFDYSRHTDTHMKCRNTSNDSCHTDTQTKCGSTSDDSPNLTICLFRIVSYITLLYYKKNNKYLFVSQFPSKRHDYNFCRLISAFLTKSIFNTCRISGWSSQKFSAENHVLRPKVFSKIKL
jgi:hypothetical protein